MDTLKLTVIAVALSFRPTNPNAQPPEVWTGFGPNDVLADGVNNIPQQVGFGNPQLGVVIPGLPLGAGVFGGSMEIKATLQPNIDQLPSVFDFKRVKQGISRIFQFTQIVSIPGEGNCPVGWCDDDPTAFDHLDEDLILDPMPANTVFVMDVVRIPSLSNTLPPCQGGIQQEGVAILNAKNMREWLNVDGYRASATKEWFARIEVGCFQNQNTWTFTQNFTAPPRLGVGNPLLPQINIQVENNDKSLHTHKQVKKLLNHAVVDLANHDLSQRMRAYGVIYSAIEQNILTIGDRHWLMHNLKKLASIRHDEEAPVMKSWYLPEQSAMLLLGKLMAVEAMPLLIERIGDSFLGPFARKDETPASIALADIGTPAIGPLLNKSVIANEAQWRALYWALWKIDQQSPIVRQAMRAYLDATVGPGAPAAATDEEKAQRQLLKTRLEKFLATPEPRRPKPKPVANNANSTPQTISAK